MSVEVKPIVVSGFDRQLKPNGRVPSSSSAPCDSKVLHRWAQIQLPTLNRQALAQTIPLETLVSEMNAVLLNLPDPTLISPEECKRLLVPLGMIGSSVERHFQQSGKPAGLGIQSLKTGMCSFSRYLATLAARVGGPPRDSFLSYAIWNVPTISVYLPGEAQPLYTLPGLFPEADAPLTFSDDLGEQHFLYLLKRCAALEAAANQALATVIQLDLRLDQHEALRQIETATLLLRAVREEMLAFMQCPEFTAPFFLDVLRQYACAWDAAETFSPPSGAHDHHFIVRDYLLETSIEGYQRHVMALFHVLDQTAQQEIDTARTAISLLKRIAWQLGVESLAELESYSSDVLQRLVEQDHPWVSAYYRLYKANSELSATHWSMISRYIVKPMQTRAEDGPVISNHEGSTHMGMPKIEGFMRDRKLHPLQLLKDFVPAQLLICTSEQLLTLVRS